MSVAWATAVNRAPTVQSMRWSARTTAGACVRRRWSRVKEPRCLRNWVRSNGKRKMNAITSRSAVRTNGSVVLDLMKTAEVEHASTPRNSSMYLRNIADTVPDTEEGMQPIVGRIRRMRLEKPGDWNLNGNQIP
jgi:hypothetical protein